MNDQTTQLIEKLAEKLGTTTEYLWGVLIQQAGISATINLVLSIIVFIAIAVFIKVHLNFSKERKINEYRSANYYYEHDAAGPIMAGIALVLFIFLLSVVFVGIPETITGYMNPEYWALKEVLKQI